MTLDTQLILDAINQLFDKVDARWAKLDAEIDARWAKRDAARVASRGVPMLTQSADVGAGAVADNWGGLFDGGYDSDEQRHEEPIVADSWGELFEQPAHFQEEGDLEFPDASAYVAPAPESCLASNDPDALAGIAPPMSPSSSSAPAPAPVARAVDEENTTSITPIRCSTQVRTPSPASINIAAVQLASSSLSKAPLGPATAPTSWLHAWPAVPLAPAALSTKEDIPTNPPTKCSTECLTHGIEVLKSICTAPHASFCFTDGIPLDVNNDCSIKYSQERYITTTIPPPSSGIVLLCVSIGGHEYQKMSESMTSTLIPLPAHVFGKEQWPPPLLVCNTFLSEIVKLCFNFWPPVSYDSATVQYRSPWPPPMQWEVQVDGIHLRPTPWPSFSSLATVIQWAKVLSRM